MGKINLNAVYDFNLTLIGIVSAARDYRLCWFLNNAFLLGFVKNNDLEFDAGEQGMRYFSIYTHIDTHTETEYHFIRNKGTEGYLIPERKETDYFWLINRRLPENEELKIINTLNKLEVVQAAYSIELKKLKSRENLIL